MPFFPTAILPKNILAILRRSPNHVGVAPRLVEMAQSEAAAVFAKLETSEAGLTEEEAEKRLEEYGPNAVAEEHRHGRLALLGMACANPSGHLASRAGGGLVLP